MQRRVSETGVVGVRPDPQFDSLVDGLRDPAEQVGLGARLVRALLDVLGTSVGVSARGGNKKNIK